MFTTYQTVSLLALLMFAGWCIISVIKVGTLKKIYKIETKIRNSKIEIKRSFKKCDHYTLKLFASVSILGIPFLYLTLVVGEAIDTTGASTILYVVQGTFLALNLCSASPHSNTR